jgi:glyoxylase-like metal-dependent hydrolase (beta-lactamase superfamily II)
MIPASGYYVESFGQGTYMVTDGSYQSLFLVSTAGVIVVDCPPTTGTKLLYAIGNVTSLPITHLIYSHSHADHIGGAIILTTHNPKLITIAHADTKELLAQTNDPNRPLPAKTFKETYTLSHGNQTLNLAYKGEAHLRGNIFIHAPAAKVLMLVDIVFPGWTPFSQLGEVVNVPGFIAAHDQILAYDFLHFVGGHLDRSGTRADVLVQQEYVHDLFDNCARVINLTATADPVLGAAAIFGPVLKANPGNSWASFKAYLDITGKECADRTNKKWLGRLAAADVFQFDNAVTMVESLRIDYGVLGAFANT